MLLLYNRQLIIYNTYMTSRAPQHAPFTASKGTPALAFETAFYLSSLPWHCPLSTRPVQIKWRGVDVIICLELEWGSDCLHMVERQEEHLAWWTVRVILSGARCRLSAYSWCHCRPKLRHLLPHLNPDWIYLCGTGLCRLSREEAI